MKFIVDELPEYKKCCPYAQWKPYPPIIEESGNYICKINGKNCNLYTDSKQCFGLKVKE